MKKLTTEDFIRRAKEVHGDKYDYSKVDYIDNRTKVCIICPEHGEFWQQPRNHLLGQACPKCAYKTRWESRGRITTENFIKKARKVHGDKYDYSLVEYKGANVKVEIICKKCGKHFKQTPHNHLHSQGCLACSGRKQLTTEEFIRRAKEVHGDKYDYSKVEYVNKNTKVKIICPIHGEFEQIPDNHLHGHGCHKCVNCKQLTTEEFIHRAKEVHGDKYDYSKVEYINSHTKVKIICPIHGEFEQEPNSHLEGKGCPNCYHKTKKYKFNLLEEFESEYDFKAFLANNDINILLVIIRNIEPKFEPIKRDIERALAHSNEVDPIKALTKKYASDSEDELDEDFNIATAPNVDFDDDNAIDSMVYVDTSKNDNTPTIDEVIKNTEKEIKVINKVEHMLTPEDREYIMNKFLNDKRRMWMYARENSVR